MIQELKKMNVKRALVALGKLFSYPSNEYLLAFDDNVSEAIESFPAIQGDLERFSKFVKAENISKVEELYTRAFDLAPICSPYVSGYIYGDENFDRGSFLSALNDRMLEFGFDKQGELCDHLGVILRFCQHLSEEEIDDLIELCLLGPVKEMKERIADNPYEDLFNAVQTVIAKTR